MMNKHQQRFSHCFALQAKAILIFLSFFMIKSLSAQSYCASKSNAPTNDWVSNVSLNTLNNSSTQTRPDRYVLGYSDWTDKSTTLVKGQTYALKITPGMRSANNLLNHYYRVWIDYNNNGVFEDSEKNLERTNVNPMTANVLVPTTATTCMTRMRVILKYGGYPSACGTFSKGEVEDYSIVIKDATSSNLPDLTLANFIIPTPSVQQGNVLNWKVDIKNIGTAAATSNFTVKSYISTDNVLSANDVQDGIIQTANFDAGFSVSQVPGASTIVSTIPAGQYYLILKVDADNQVTESNENNNIVVSVTKFTVSAQPTTTCSNVFKLQGVSSTACLANAIPNTPNYSFYSGSLQILGSSLSNGFRLTTTTLTNFTRTSTLFAKSAPSATPPSGSNFRSCPTGNWLYFTLNGVGSDERQTYIDDNKFVRIQYWGSATNPDSIFVEFDLNTYPGFLPLKSVLKTQNCNPCFAKDQIAPIYNCPTTTVQYSLPFTPTQLTLSNIVAGTNVRALDNCGVFNGFNTLNNVYYGGVYPIHLVAYDSAGNKSACDFNVKMPEQTTANDIALSIATTPAVYQRWASQNFTVSAKNNGSQAFTNVKIEFKFPTNTTNGGTATPSVGVWSEWCAGGVQCFTWTIPTLAANTTATLNVPIFVLNAVGAMVATTNLLSSTPVDNTVANNTATITVNPVQTAVAQLQAQTTQQIPIVIQKIAPNPSDGEVIVELESLDNREVQFDVSNTVGGTVFSEKRAVDKGMNRLQFDVSALPQGVYLVTPSTNRGRNVPTKFVKM